MDVRTYQTSAAPTVIAASGH